MSAAENLSKQIRKKKRTPPVSRKRPSSNGHLQLRLNRLKTLCDTLDPYRPLTSTMIKELEYFQIYDHSDPFRITNQLLILMEDMLEESQKQNNNNN